MASRGLIFLLAGSPSCFEGFHDGYASHQARPFVGNGTIALSVGGAYICWRCGTVTNVSDVCLVAGYGRQQAGGRRTTSHQPRLFVDGPRGTILPQGVASGGAG